ncbi:gpW family head-tail joining protein [Escherichia coli]|uniref:gpW family head-tail joining protein n=1 Tax=Escherichia coli TaxID=562 RepID=UPI001F1084FE|nr:gpW family head-tail joining protein [Escherichia coli]UMR99576.1 phage head-tail adapter protein [Escherichia coli]
MNNYSGVFAGMSREQLQAALAEAQRAYIELLSGRRGVSFSYAQGDGTRQVTYSQASVADLVALTESLQLALGLRVRRPLTFRY